MAANRRANFQLRSSATDSDWLFAVIVQQWLDLHIRSKLKLMEGPPYNGVQCRLESQNTQFNTNGAGQRRTHFPLHQSAYPQLASSYLGHHHNRRVVLLPTSYN